jgi:hypothetical protein
MKDDMQDWMLDCFQEIQKESLIKTGVIRIFKKIEQYDEIGEKEQQEIGKLLLQIYDFIKMTENYWLETSRKP